MAETTRVLASDVINQANQAGLKITDDVLLATCPACGQVPLSSCEVSGTKDTKYVHPPCGQTLVIIGVPNPDDQPWPGRGYRIGDFVLRNAVDIVIAVPGATRLKFNTSPHALAETQVARS